MNMWAAAGATPTVVNAGTTMTAEMMYDAVTGTARPRIQTASAEKRTVRASDPPAIPTMRPAALRPRPVSVTTPTMMPATAVVASTDNTSSPPATSDSTSLLGVSHQSRDIKKLTPTAARVDQNTARKGERPMAIRTATRTSEVKCRYARQLDGGTHGTTGTSGTSGPRWLVSAWLASSSVSEKPNEDDCVSSFLCPTYPSYPSYLSYPSNLLHPPRSSTRSTSSREPSVSSP